MHLFIYNMRLITYQEQSPVSHVVVRKNINGLLLEGFIVRFMHTCWICCMFIFALTDCDFNKAQI